jgi:hypothetical protein
LGAGEEREEEREVIFLLNMFALLALGRIDESGIELTPSYPLPSKRFPCIVNNSDKIK